MIRLLIKNWWLLFLRGVLAIAFAIFIYAFLPFLPMPFLRQFAFSGLTLDLCLVRLRHWRSHHGSRGARSGAGRLFMVFAG